MKQGIRRSLSVLAMALLLTGILAACGSDSEEVKPTVTREVVEGAPPTRTATLPAEATPQEPAGGAASPAPGTDGGTAELPTTLEIDMVDLAFEPTSLTIPANTDVTINAVNKGALPHTFTITDVADTGEVAGGSSAQVVLNLPAGEYDFHCAVPGHLEAGMVGTLKVVEGGAATAASPEGAASPETAGTPAESTAEAPAAAATTVEVDMVDLAFNPTEFTIPADTDVTVNLVNSGALPHTFDVEDVESGEIPGGGTGSVVVNLPAGTYEYWCAIPGHKDAGMVGTLTVVAEGAAASPEASPAASPIASPVAVAPVNLDMVELAFKPDTFEIPANIDVTVNLSNSGNLPHNFTIKDQDVSVDLAAGEKTTFTLNLPPGTYDFICDVPGHEDAGMVGTLTVVEGAVSTPVADGAAASSEPVEVDMVDLAFNPTEFTIPANTNVTVNLVNSGALPHTFDVEDIESGEIPGGGTGSVVVNLPAGTYQYFCAIPGHEAAGMVGTLTVK